MNWRCTRHSYILAPLRLQLHFGDKFTTNKCKVQIVLNIKIAEVACKFFLNIEMGVISAGVVLGRLRRGVRAARGRRPARRLSIEVRYEGGVR